ncbi:MAG: hypothetical protein VB038_07065 [Methanobrevibacter sp.]|nr:hypothetical protein [Methanobrevibacter sp.]MEA4957468.1 hypothetical protein [Methanobrevibacter sp.]
MCSISSFERLCSVDEIGSKLQRRYRNKSTINNVVVLFMPVAYILILA